MTVTKSRFSQCLFLFQPASEFQRDWAFPVNNLNGKSSSSFCKHNKHPRSSACALQFTKLQLDLHRTHICVFAFQKASSNHTHILSKVRCFHQMWKSLLFSLFMLNIIQCKSLNTSIMSTNKHLVDYVFICGAAFSLGSKTVE